MVCPECGNSFWKREHCVQCDAVMTSCRLSPSCAGRGVAPEPSHEGSTELVGTDDRDWLLLLFVSLQKASDCLLLEAGSGSQSSSGCFFSMSGGEKRRRQGVCKCVCVYAFGPQGVCPMFKDWGGMEWFEEGV